MKFVDERIKLVDERYYYAHPCILNAHPRILRNQGMPYYNVLQEEHTYRRSHPNKVFTKEQSKRMKLVLLNYLIGLTIIMGVLAAINESDSLKIIILCLLIILFNQLAGMLIYHNTSHLHPKKRRT